MITKTSHNCIMCGNSKFLAHASCITCATCGSLNSLSEGTLDTRVEDQYPLIPA